MSQPPHNGTLVLRFVLKLHCNHDHAEPRDGSTQTARSLRQGPSLSLMNNRQCRRQDRMSSSARLPAQRQEPALHSPGTPHICPGLDVHKNMLCPPPLLSLGPKAPPSLGLQASQLNSSVCVTQGQQTERPTDPTMLTGRSTIHEAQSVLYSQIV